MSRFASTMSSLVIAAVLVLPTASSAQDACGGGRVRESHGRCCWPGQSWARDIGRCEGPPSCPPGTTAEGDDCLTTTHTDAPPVVMTPVPGPTTPPAGRVYTGGPIAAPPASPGSVGTVSTVGSMGSSVLGPTGGPAEWPTAPYDGPDGLRNPTLVRQPQMDLVIAGGVIFGLGYVTSIVLGAASLGSDPVYWRAIDGFGEYAPIASSSSCRDQAGAWAFVPVLGPIAALAAAASCDVPDYVLYDEASGTVGAGSDAAYQDYTRNSFLYQTLGLIAQPVAGVFQLLGFGLLLGGLLDERPVLMPSAAIGSARLSLSNGAVGADIGGLTLRIDL